MPQPKFHFSVCNKTFRPVNKIIIYLLNLTNRQSAFVPHDRPIYFRIGSKKWYLTVGTCALNNVSLVSDFNVYILQTRNHSCIKTLVIIRYNS